MIINNSFEISYLLIAFALLRTILVGELLSMLQLQRWHPKMLDAAVGALLGFVLIEAVAMFT
ncbi:hypothetical protein [Paraburkholderia haematera]|uniref:Uncharacterized protein n=1 Tax=Paraburkholderia haematera TaxID=2793077 RepID=A0ABM8SYT1_9BURK|nr:hypothetical protein [Paraburkholderia haematera]CAE6842124.1 hypothetical protein R69888_07013 [Paraburkholderia haematera]